MNQKEKIQALLHRWADMKAQQDVIKMHFQDLIKQEIPQEYLTKLDDIRAEEQSSIDALDTGLNALEDVIKGLCVEHGESIDIGVARVSYVNGRRTVKVADAERLAKKIPAVAEIINQGEPTARIKETGKT